MEYKKITLLKKFKLSYKLGDYAGLGGSGGT